MGNEYTVVDSFQYFGQTVLVLDRNFEAYGAKYAKIWGAVYDFNLNSMKNWIILPYEVSGKGFIVEFE